MIKKFLKAKHWQLFSLMYGIPFVIQIIIFAILVISVGIDQDTFNHFSFLQFFPLMMVIYSGLFFGWFWSIVMGLQKKIPKNTKMKINRFKVLFFIPLSYILIISIYLGTIFSGISLGEDKPQPLLISTIMILVFPLHLFSMFCMFYLLYFVSKTIKTVELQRDVTFRDYVGEFFLIWFFPIGIWFIQPKINKMTENDLNHIE